LDRIDIGGDLGPRTAIEVDRDASPATNDRDMVPGLDWDRRPAGSAYDREVFRPRSEEIERGGDKDEDIGAPANAEVIAARVDGPFRAERVEEALRVVWRSIPEPELDGIGLAQALERSLQAAAREVD